jgi:hypothetical protein
LHIELYKPSHAWVCCCHAIVTVREVGGGTEIAVVDADVMLAVVENNELRPVGREASERLQRALASV